LITDTNNHRIRLLHLLNGSLTNFAGTGASGFVDGNSSVTSFNLPAAIAFDRSTNDTWIVADSENNAIRRVYSNGTVETVGGDGFYGFKDTTAMLSRFKRPQGLLYCFC
jgi:hypothetical protein